MTIAKAMKGTTQMNKTVIEMALEAGLIDFRDPLSAEYTKAVLEDLTAFADLVRADEREACAQVCEDHFSSDGDWCSKAIRARGQS